LRAHAPDIHMRVAGVRHVPMISCRIVVMKEAKPGWQAYELQCGHDAMIDMPQRLAEILIAVS